MHTSTWKNTVVLPREGLLCENQVLKTLWCVDCRLQLPYVAETPCAHDYLTSLCGQSAAGQLDVSGISFLPISEVSSMTA